MDSDFEINVTITMLGARGVGKTSMLAAMHKDFNRVVEDPKLQLVPEPQAARTLSRRVIELQRLAAGAPGRVDTTKGIEGDDDISRYPFTLSHTGVGGSLRITFVDYPGGWITEGSAKEDIVRKALQDARVILVPIDAPPLMELDEWENEEVNQPTLVASFLREALLRRPRDTLVMFVVMRGERWLQDGAAYELYERFQERCWELLRAVEGFKDNAEAEASAVFGAIQTLGPAVRFDHYSGATPVFVKVADRAYQPIDCEQPLRFALNYAMRELQQYADEHKRDAGKELNKRPWWKRRLHSVGGLFGWKPEQQKEFDAWLARSHGLIEVVNNFTAGCKKDGAFRIIQNGNALGLPDSPSAAPRVHS